MEKARIFFVSLAVLLFSVGLSPAASSQETARIVGVVLDAQGQPVGGVEISAQDASGQVVARTIANAKGEYTLEGLAPGQYNLTLNPLTTGFQGQTVVASVTEEGLTVSWTLSATAPAIAAATPGIAAGGGLFGLGTTGTFLGGVGLIGAGVGGAAVGGTGGGGSGGNSPVSPAQ